MVTHPLVLSSCRVQTCSSDSSDEQPAVYFYPCNSTGQFGRSERAWSEAKWSSVTARLKIRPPARVPLELLSESISTALKHAGIMGDFLSTPVAPTPEAAVWWSRRTKLQPHVVITVRGV